MNNDVNTMDNNQTRGVVGCAIGCTAACTALCAADAILPVGDIAGAAGGTYTAAKQ